MSASEEIRRAPVLPPRYLDRLRTAPTGRPMVIPDDVELIPVEPGPVTRERAGKGAERPVEALRGSVGTSGPSGFRMLVGSDYNADGSGLSQMWPGRDPYSVAFDSVGRALAYYDRDGVLLRALEGIDE